MHIILFRNCEFWRNQRRKIRAFLKSVSDITLCGYHINVRHFERKERVGKVCELRHGHTICTAIIRNG